MKNFSKNLEKKGSVKMVSKEVFCKLIDTMESYAHLQTTLSLYGYTIEEDNVGNQLMCAAIDMINDTLPPTVRDLMIVEEYCWGLEFGRVSGSEYLEDVCSSGALYDRLCELIENE